MDNIYKGTFVALEAWTKSHKNEDEIVGDIHFPDDDMIYSGMLDSSLLNKWKVFEFEAEAEIPVSLVRVQKSDDDEYDFEVETVNFEVENKFSTTVTNLVADTKNDNKVKGRVTISQDSKPGIRCYINIDLGTNTFTLPSQKSASDGVHAVVQYNSKREWPFSAIQLVGGCVDNLIECPQLTFPKTTHVPDEGFDEVTFQFGTLSICTPLSGQLWHKFKDSLDSYRLRLNIPQHNEFTFPVVYKLWKNEQNRIDLNKAHIRRIFSKQTCVAIETDIEAKAPSTWFRPEGVRYDVSIQHNEMMLHGFRDIENNTSVQFQIEDVWEKKQRETDEGTEIFYNYNNRWRIKHIQPNEQRVLALDGKEFNGEVLFDWSSIGAEHDLDDDHLCRLVPSTQSQCWVTVEAKGVGKVAIQVNPSMLKSHLFIPSGSQVKIKLRVAQRRGFEGINEEGVFEIWCASIYVDIEKRTPSISRTRRLKIESVEESMSKNDNKMLKISFSDPTSKSITVKEFSRPLSYLEAMKLIDVTDKYCQVTAFQINNTLHVKRIDLVEM
ncbi:hypothetical protein BCU30_008610 [Vibrio lentus]|uniref:hypothetical protein n=1 Tax=Vibrio lentus TaxID=136468 RepID=UPI000C819232|nr:hypothetical protein [Vibrio lentus]PMJ14495.1 hypothetical protein BCU30_01325 [Vibrio lentus]